MTPRSYLFLDIDGVLNPTSIVLPGDWRQVQIDRLYVWTSADLGRWLTRLVDGGVQIVWATTWIQIPGSLALLADSLGLPSDLPRIDRLEWPDDDLLESGKRPGVERWLDEHGVDPIATPVVWADDDLGPDDIRWAEDAGVTAVKVGAIYGLADPSQRVRIESALEVVTSTESDASTSKDDVA